MCESRRRKHFSFLLNVKSSGGHSLRRRQFRPFYATASFSTPRSETQSKPRKGEAYPAHDTLANELSVSVSSVKRSIIKLQRAGILHVVSGRKRGRSNCYSLFWPSDSGSNVVRILRGGNQ